VTSFTFTNSDPALADLFGTQTYNVCVFLEDTVVAAGTLEASDVDGVTSTAVELPGQYQVCVRGTWSNRNGMELLDAEYTSQDNWTTFADGLPASDPLSASLGPNFGDVQVNGQFVDWGAYSTEHKYCTTVTLAAGDSVTLGVFDTSAEAYADNVGSLTYTVRYLSP